MEKLVAGLIVLVSIGGAVVAGEMRRGSTEGARCGPGFVATGTRCVAPAGFTVPDTRVLIPAASIAVGPSDWEAQGQVGARTIHVDAFRIDAFEVTRGALSPGASDPARAASGVTRDDAAAFCASRGGRLPTEDEWVVAADSAMNPPRRYAWGDTGAVCRRAAWGLESGPCASGGSPARGAPAGPDTVGAHPDGDSPLGLHDMAGNVAEWVTDEPRPGSGMAKGGSWRSALAAELRVWARLELPPDVHDARVGFRCVYAP
ncbi:MAG TPA: SUMF1/EgtB/PvdO family nonheme iron enzyme [Polyangiaceae bacterium]|nr:SUMF1/EgtB/PvdO family nonheme iron enzyme [Polyangiaceae bacterium]